MIKPWVQVAVDATTIEEARRLASIALQAGADWIEVGTPLITFVGMTAIDVLVEIAGDRPVVADFKAQDGVEKYFREAGRRGARVATVLAVAPDASIAAAIRGGAEVGVEVVADLFAVKQNELPHRAREVEALGVDYLMLHLGHDESSADPSLRCLAGLEEVISEVRVPVGVSTFTREEATEAISLGASFVVQGNPILNAPDASEQLTSFVRAIKG